MPVLAARAVHASVTHAVIESARNVIPRVRKVFRVGLLFNLERSIWRTRVALGRGLIAPPVEFLVGVLELS